jgi:hypothetical protein
MYHFFDENLQLASSNVPPAEGCYSISKDLHDSIMENPTLYMVRKCDDGIRVSVDVEAYRKSMYDIVTKALDLERVCPSNLTYLSACVQAERGSEHNGQSLTIIETKRRLVAAVEKETRIRLIRHELSDKIKKAKTAKDLDDLYEQANAFVSSLRG